MSRGASYLTQFSPPMVGLAGGFRVASFPTFVIVQELFSVNDSDHFMINQSLVFVLQHLYLSLGNLASKQALHCVKVECRDFERRRDFTVYFFYISFYVHFKSALLCHWFSERTLTRPNLLQTHPPPAAR